MKRRKSTKALLVLMACLSTLPAGAQANTAWSRVEAVFVLDSTGSMSGLIEGAKTKIWSIANTIVASRIAAEGRIGLITYRDIGDQYVTLRHDMNDDFDVVFRDLRSFRANGGGDGPESVNQALNEAVRLMSWTPRSDVLKIIFLVGDAPPHMDYQHDVPYRRTCAEAVQAGLIINTVQCGNHGETRRVWQEIARLGEGSYVALGQTGNMTTIATPHDKEILRLTTELNRTVVAYGSSRDQELTRGKLAAAEAAPAGVAADRSAFNLASGGKVIQGRGDLVADWRDGLVELEALDPQSLPAGMRPMTPGQRKEHLEKMQARRDSLNFQLADLSGDRAAYLEQEQRRLASSGKGDAFDAKVAEIIAEQAARLR